MLPISWCFSSPTVQHLYYTPDMKSSHQSSEKDTNLLWTDMDWSPTEFEELADSIDKDDNAVNGDSNDKLQKYRELGRPYMLSAGIDGKIRFVFTMSPLITESDFIQCDIMYDECKQYPYIS